MGSTGWSSLTRPVLRPGLRVVRRDDAHLQVGLDPPDRLVLRDRPGLYDALTGRDRSPRGEVREVLDRLVADGWLVDAGQVGRAAQQDAARRTPVTLVTDALLGDSLTRACATAGLRVAETAGTRLVATVGEPRRALSDQLVRDDIAHLWLAVLPRAVRIGPFVEPGRTACLRCVDAHLGERDARRATVLHQLEELPVAPYGGWDPLLVQLAAAWAVRDVVRRLDGRPPALRSASVIVSADLEVTRRDWLRHPHCGCAWG
jgi:hypothetical protein